MALFSVQRYMGDDDENDPAPQANDILQKLNKEALKRKRAKLEQSDADTSVVESPGDKSHSVKKKKKKRLSDVNDTEKLNEETIEKKQKPKVNNESEKDADANVSEMEDVDKEAQETEEGDAGPDLPGSEVNEDEMDTQDTVQDTSNTSGGQRRSEVGGFTVIGDVWRRKQEKVHRVLPEWLAQPSVISEDIRNKKVELTDVEGLDDDIIERLKNSGISYFFPVQAQVIPILLAGTQNCNLRGKAGYRPSDVCCSAPTGSGKTLTFVLPIIQALKHRVICKVRALVVLPVGDLATQVYNVFCTYCEGTDLRVGLLTGQKTISNEQQTLVNKGLRCFHSKVDIVVATPGRLVDHINQTQGFDLSHLRYLIIDEADRVVDEIKQDWLTQVENAVFGDETKPLDVQINGTLPRLHRPLPGQYTAANATKMEMPLQKLLFSATLSQNPEKLQQLNLFQPKLFTSVVKKGRDSIQLALMAAAEENNDSALAVETAKDDNDTKEEKTVQGEFIGKFTTPSGLTEYFVEADKSSRPLMVLHLLHHLKFKGMLCFTNTLEDTHRLYLLIKLYGGINVEEFSSRLQATRRARILKKFSSGKIDMLICSDSMARGMDVDNVQCVISYEPPPYLKTYIHRVGRTARAGKAGTAITLLETKEIFHFKKMIKDAGKEPVKKLKIVKTELEPLIAKYRDTLQELPAVIKAEKSKKRKR